MQRDAWEDRWNGLELHWGLALEFALEPYFCCIEVARISCGYVTPPTSYFIDDIRKRLAAGNPSAFIDGDHINLFFQFPPIALTCDPHAFYPLRRTSGRPCPVVSIDTKSLHEIIHAPLTQVTASGWLTTLVGHMDKLGNSEFQRLLGRLCKWIHPNCFLSIAKKNDATELESNFLLETSDGESILFIKIRRAFSSNSSTTSPWITLS